MTSPAAFAKWARERAEAFSAGVESSRRMIGNLVMTSESDYLKGAHDTYALLGPLVAAGDELQQAERDFRRVYETFGDGSSQAGRAWDLMRRAGDKYRQALADLEKKMRGGE